MGMADHRDHRDAPDAACDKQPEPKPDPAVKPKLYKPAPDHNCNPSRNDSDHFCRQCGTGCHGDCGIT
jgi:hypothetical protein